MIMVVAAENIAKIESEITDLVTDLYDVFNSGKIENIDEQGSLDRYIKRVSRIGLLAWKEGIVTLQDVCLVYQQLLNNFKAQEKELTEHVKERLEQWPMLATALLTESIDDGLYTEIVGFFEDDIWPQKISYDDVAFLRSEIRSRNESLVHEASDSFREFGGADISFEVETNNTTYPESHLTIPYDNITLEALQQEVIETMADLLVDLNESSDQQVVAEFADSLNLCADRIELVGITVATMGFMGLMDASQYFQYGLRELAELEVTIDIELQEYLEQWPSLVISYLADPNDTDNAKQLTDYIRDMSWTPNLLEEEVSSLHDQLLNHENRKYGEILTREVAADSGVDSSEENATDNQTATVENNADSVNGDAVNEEGIEINSAGVGKTGPDEELLDIVKQEIEANLPVLDEIWSSLFDPDASPVTSDELVKKYTSLLDRFRLAAESIGLSGLSRILENIAENVQFWTASAKTPDSEKINFISKWPVLVIEYLEKVTSLETCGKLASEIIDSCLPIELGCSVTELSQELNNPICFDDEEIEQRATLASQEDVSLTLPEDVNRQLLETLLHELPGQTAQFTAAINRLVEGSANLQVVEDAQRIAHTLKGSANTVGVRGIASITHHIEDILTAFVKHTRLPGATLADVLMNAADVLEAMSESLLGMGPAPDNAQAILQEVLDWANRIDQKGISEINDVSIESIGRSEQKLNPTHGEQERSFEIGIKPMLRVPAELMDEMLRIVGESLTLSGQLQERVQQLGEQVRHEQEQNKLFQQLCFELEQITDIRGMVTQEINGTYNEVFDSLELDQYNELHTITHRLVEAATDAKELTLGIEDGLNVLDVLLLEQSRLQKDTQNVVMRTRMVPAQNIVPRLQRAVRQTCRFTGKQALLDVKGAETLIDSDILDDLVDPLMHVIRNAIDHGIEVTDERNAKGKDKKGKITLSFDRQGDHIIIECSDDGAGLDYEAIKAQAVRAGLIGDEQAVSEEELTRLIWLPGFTTKDQTTQISGRGIGMDAVYSQVTSMKGTLNIVSLREFGTNVEIYLPLSLISMHALLVTAYNQQLAISNRGIEQIIPPGDGVIEHTEENLLFYMDDEVYELTELETLLNVPVNRANGERTILLVHDETGAGHAVSLEKVHTSRDVVVKQLGQFLPEIAGIEGATILGDGSVAPVIDLPILLRNAVHEVTNPWIVQLEDSGANMDSPYALIVDDSLSARRSLAEYVKDLGYQILTAKDGLEAIEVIDNKCPDIILVDFEMPRMNGVELTNHVRADEKTRDIPIIMITSRATEKHQTMATSAGVDVYLTKPYSEDVLMEHVHRLYQQYRCSA